MVLKPEFMSLEYFHYNVFHLITLSNEKKWTDFLKAKVLLKICFLKIKFLELEVEQKP
jgi:hypothetical protein